MLSSLYEMIFKRKSFHVFKDIKKLEKNELSEIEMKLMELIPLYNNINVGMRLVERNQTTCRRGEYCVLFYSEKKEGYLKNIGYIGEQLDLWLASKNIGVCWCGTGKTSIPYDELDFVIMLAIEKVDEKDFRIDYTKTKRKEITKIWDGNNFSDIIFVARYSPSAYNMQPWYVETHDKEITIKCVKSKIGQILIKGLADYNQIDMGIFILIIELCFKHNNITFERTLADGNLNIDVVKYAIL